MTSWTDPMVNPHQMVYIVTQNSAQARMIAKERKLIEFGKDCLWVPQDSTGAVIRGKPGLILVGPGIMSLNLVRTITNAVSEGFRIETVSIPEVRAS